MCVVESGVWPYNRPECGTWREKKGIATVCLNKNSYVRLTGHKSSQTGGTFGWIHRFIDGNGRVARLVSHGLFLRHLDTGGVWSVARGLARSATRYKELLSNCDLPRRNDLDVRGNLSEASLAGFTAYFLQTCLDQVAFMEVLVRPDQLRARVLVWADEEAKLGGLPPRAGRLLEAVLFRGELPRADAAVVLDVLERTARRVTSELVQRGVLVSDSTRAPLRLAFPAALAVRWMPRVVSRKAVVGCMPYGAVQYPRRWSTSSRGGKRSPARAFMRTISTEHRAVGQCSNSSALDRVQP